MAIFGMIAGTYTPVAAFGLGGASGCGLLGLVWIGADAGAVLKRLARARFDHGAVLT